MSNLVPGLSKYPELEKQFQQRLSRLGGSGCSSCAKSKLYQEFSRKVRELVERDKLMGRR